MSDVEWDERYASTPLLWNREPNRFVVSRCGSLAPGRALDLACGEGRNAVWLASRGWRVTGLDHSTVAIERSRAIAGAAGVDLELRRADALTAPLEHRAYDLVLLSYLQLPPAERTTVLERALDAVAPGGTFLLVAHDARNLAEGHGGPKDPAVLWTAEEAVAALERDGLVVEEAGTVLRDVEGAERAAIDTLVRATRPA
jgi:SAM-dependent methyltransferase